MQLWILFYDMGFEGQDFRGAFDSQESAMAHAQDRYSKTRTLIWTTAPFGELTANCGGGNQYMIDSTYLNEAY